MPTIQTNKREGSIRLRRKRGGGLTVEQDWYFRIRADSLNQDRAAILYDTPGVPQFGVVYGGYGLTLASADATRLDEDPLLWDAVYNLSNSVEEGVDRNPATGQPQTGDPTEWIPWVELGFEEYEEVLRDPLPILSGELHPDLGGSDAVGYNARSWMNSAGGAFETGFVVRKRIITRAFTQFEPASVTIDQIEQRNDTLNLTPYLGRAKRTLRLVVDGAAIGTYYGVRCWRIDYKLMWKRDDWRVKNIDAGWMFIDEFDQKKAFIDDGMPVVGRLNGQGFPLSDSEPSKMLYFKDRESIEFADFLRLHLT